MNPNPAGQYIEPPSRIESWRMFDRIAHRYDLLNRVLSLGQDILWRRRLARNLDGLPRPRVLDLATGTADVLLSICQTNEQVRFAAGLDMSVQMLEVAGRKVQNAGLAAEISLIQADAMHLPVRERSVDAVTIAFGIRNVIDFDQTLREMYRVLNPGGRALILEFSLPSHNLFRKLYLFYFRHILPRIGAVISGDDYAYRYLNQTVETFPYGQDFCDHMTAAGFRRVKQIPLTFGIAAIYRGEKA
ncbi:MAG: bifunctional demethylmenaquinone methyltransferase/2-methoxy-6-polyprenyl-1,4-benzoquinol methylase UbiE [Deltaproteobacteria bacterium]|nr:bifunctional demethylmenaquinone methyltransferase/2-methoxy-6-polyprenyl-1,4-benzoquinol methylase UbiE [Deltaproteobacteria bacterium]